MPMIDIGGKAVTSRRAEACGSIALSPAAFTAVADNSNPKGNVLAFAEIAGLGGVKSCATHLPLCHPLPIEFAGLAFRLIPATATIEATCQVHATARTGVEMEALAGVQAALLCIYDMSKAVDPAITIGPVRLNWKLGGKSGPWIHPDYHGSVPKPPGQAATDLAGRNAVVITLSDRAAGGEYADTSGPALVALLQQMNATCPAPHVIADDAAKLTSTVRTLLVDNPPHLIVTSGGTGVSPRDITPETLQALFDREIPGIGELLRSDGAHHTPLSWASRATGGISGKTLIVALPGRENAVREGFAALRILLPHLVAIATGKS